MSLNEEHTTVKNESTHFTETMVEMSETRN